MSIKNSNETIGNRRYGLSACSTMPPPTAGLIYLLFQWFDFVNQCYWNISYNKTNYMYKFLKFIFGLKLYMFRTVPLSIIVPSCSCSQAVCKLVWHMPLLCLQWKTPHDGQRKRPKHVEFHSKSKFENLPRLVGFIISNLSRWCTVTWTSILKYVMVKMF